MKVMETIKAWIDDPIFFDETFQKRAKKAFEEIDYKEFSEWIEGSFKEGPSIEDVETIIIFAELWNNYPRPGFG